MHFSYARMRALLQKHVQHEKFFDRIETARMEGNILSYEVRK